MFNVDPTSAIWTAVRLHRGSETAIHAAGIVTEATGVITATGVIGVAVAVDWGSFGVICLENTTSLLSIPFIQSMPENKKKATIAQRMVSSGTSALITKTIVTPFDVVKTYIQVFSLLWRSGIGGVHLQGTQAGH